MESAKRYDIKDAAHYLDIAPSTLRYWESEGLVRTERNTVNEYRQYSLHDLIDASEIAFYRKLGVPVKTLKNYHDLTIGSLDDALGQTEQGIEIRLAELLAVSERLATQRALNTCAKRLLDSGMQPGTVIPKRLSPIDYGDQAVWMLLVDEPWRYGLVIKADKPDEAFEAIVGTPVLSRPHASTQGARGAESGVGGEVGGNNDNKSSSEDTRLSSKPLWERGELGTKAPCMECLLHVDPRKSNSNAGELFDEARTHGMKPSTIVGTYLLTATEYAGSPRWDYYQAWVI